MEMGFGIRDDDDDELVMLNRNIWLAFCMCKRVAAGSAGGGCRAVGVGVARCNPLESAVPQAACRFDQAKPAGYRDIVMATDDRFRVILSNESNTHALRCKHSSYRVPYNAPGPQGVRRSEAAYFQPMQRPALAPPLPYRCRLAGGCAYSAGRPDDNVFTCLVVYA